MASQQTRPKLIPFTPVGPEERLAFQLFTAAYSNPEERPIKNLFEVIAEYDIAEDYLSWCVARGLDTQSGTANTQYNNVHWIYLVAWRMLGWEEFERRLNHARLIVHSLTP